MCSTRGCPWYGKRCPDRQHDDAPGRDPWAGFRARITASLPAAAQAVHAGSTSGEPPPVHLAVVRPVSIQPPGPPATPAWWPRYERDPQQTLCDPARRETPPVPVTGPATCPRCISLAAAHGIAYPDHDPAHSRRDQERVMRREAALRRISSAGRRKRIAAFAALAARQPGLTDRQYGEQIGVKPSTISTYRSHIRAAELEASSQPDDSTAGGETENPAA